MQKNWNGSGKSNMRLEKGKTETDERRKKMASKGDWKR